VRASQLLQSLLKIAAQYFYVCIKQDADHEDCILYPAWTESVLPVTDIITAAWRKAATGASMVFAVKGATFSQRQTQSIASPTSSEHRYANYAGSFVNSISKCKLQTAKGVYCCKNIRQYSRLKCQNYKLKISKTS